MVDSALPYGESRTFGDLARLTAALAEPGTDLRATLMVFAGHLAAVVPSFLGVRITVVLDGFMVTLSVDEADRAPTHRASLDVPLSALVPDATDGTMMFYAADVGALADLAALVTRSADVGGQVPSGGHRASPRSGHFLGVSGLAEFSVYNQAIGVLIDQGYPPDEARIELSRRATSDEATLTDTARDTLDHLAVTTNLVEAAKGRTRGPRLPARRTRSRAAIGGELTAREREVLRLLVGGLSTAAIAAALLVRPGTVSDHQPPSSPSSVRTAG